MSRAVLVKTAIGMSAAAVLLTPAAAFAGHGSASSATGTCAVSPNPVAVNTSYTTDGFNLPSSVIVDVLATDATGATSSLTAMTDGSGFVSVSQHAWSAGPASVKITDTSRHHNLLASCSFSISG